jgi:hypothetical protein
MSRTSLPYLAESCRERAQKCDAINALWRSFNGDGKHLSAGGLKLATPLGH